MLDSSCSVRFAQKILRGKPLRGPLFAMAGAPPAKDEHETGEASKAES